MQPTFDEYKCLKSSVLILLTILLSIFFVTTQLMMSIIPVS